MLGAAVLAGHGSRVSFGLAGNRGCRISDAGEYVQSGVISGAPFTGTVSDGNRGLQVIGHPAGGGISHADIVGDAGGSR